MSENRNPKKIWVDETNHYTVYLDKPDHYDQCTVFKEVTDDDEIKRFKRIIAKELTENDELGSEFVYIGVLKEEIASLKSALECGVEGLKKVENQEYHTDGCSCWKGAEVTLSRITEILGEKK